MGTNVNHTDRKHARLSPSGAERWLNCTPSVRFEEQFPNTPPSEYAQEGTLAHEFGDLNLRLEVGEIKKAAHTKALKKLRTHKLYSDEMEDEVKKYTDFVLFEYQAAKRDNDSAVLLVERRVDLSEYVYSGFGTTDSTIISDGVLHVIDLKYGKGVQVYAEKNSQLMLYGLGSLLEHELLFDIHTVRVTVVQPRLDHFSSWDISVTNLIDWAENTVKVKAEQADLGLGELNPGSHCKWCKAKNRCPALAAQNLSLAQHEFAPPEQISDEQLVEIFFQFPQLLEWANSISNYMLEEALKGKEWNGLKLVEGRSNRKWVDEPGALEKLREKGFENDQIINSRIKGIGDIEKLVKKANFNDLMGSYVVKPPGKPSLVSESDKREAYGISSAKKDFS